MLLNIVRSRYQDMPVFLNVNSVTAQYSYEVSGGLAAGGELINPGNASSLSGFGNLNYGFSEFPTITYIPLVGEAFAKHLYEEISSEIFFAAAQSGWAIDILMQIGIHRIGAAKNMSFGEVRLIQQFESDLKKLENFTRVIQLISILSDAEIIEFQRRIVDENTIKEDAKIVKEEKKPDLETAQYLVIVDEVPENMRARLAEFQELTGISNRKLIKMTTRTSNVKGEELVIQTRSVMAIIKFLGRGIDIPAEHRREGRVVDYELDSSDNVMKNLFPVRIHSSEDEPDKAFVQIHYQDYWYYINHNDVLSKRALEHIMILFQLKAPFKKSAGPLLTIPTR
jgi:hypothetical protein